MTMWEEFVTRYGAEIDTLLQSGDWPTIFVTGAAANIYQGLSLSTRYDSHMELNPGGDRALVLKKWAKDNSAAIKQLLSEKQYDHALEIIARPLSQPQTLLASLQTNLNKVPVVWVCGKVNLGDTSGESYYIGCDFCNRRVYAPGGNTFKCMLCGQKEAQTIKRFILNATLTDGTATIPVTFFTNEVLKLYDYICMDPAKTRDTNVLDAELQKMTVIAGVKRAKISEQGLRGNPYSVVCVSQDKTPTPNALPTDLASTSSNDVHAALPKRKLAFPTQTDTDIPPPLGTNDEYTCDDIVPNLHSTKRKT
ncbi:unnamed protein product [Cuscuta europaea]|uniref:Replication factor A C-terminal domain-containing protein n=1 Tax=Cuscuta europaea TaxID=41803 RepID=A0A9P0ZFV9_CUSEU|nr:unnamed protein product [Cuscuta europaea]